VRSFSSAQFSGLAVATKLEKPHRLWLLKFYVQFSSEMSTRCPIGHESENFDCLDRACAATTATTDWTGSNVRSLFAMYVDRLGGVRTRGGRGILTVYLLQLHRPRNAAPRGVGARRYGSQEDNAQTQPSLRLMLCCCCCWRLLLFSAAVSVLKHNVVVSFEMSSRCHI
jgi:hypothetical protein